MRLVVVNFVYPLVIKTISSRIVAGRGVRFETVTQVATGDKRNRPPNGIGRRSDTAAKLQMVFIGKKTVSENDHPSAPTIAIQEIEWHGTAMVQRIVFEVHHLIVFFSSSTGYRLKEVFVRCELDTRVRRAEVCKIAGQFSGGISDKGAGIERSVR